MRPRTSLQRIHARTAYTLLELLLALALSALIMMAIGMALDLHLRSLTVHRGQLEEAQLARAVLRHIANDLRGAVRYEPPDLSGAEEFAASAGDVALGSTDDLGETGSDDLLGDLGLDSASDESTVADIATTATSPAVPGIYGNATEIQIDVSRLPRIDQYGVNTADGQLASPSLPSDIKTIAYYLQTSGMLDSGAALYASATPIGGNSTTGLVRRELDRAVALYASANGGTTQDIAQGELMAPEISGLQFRYYDGETAYEEWDSELNGGLPSAVEVTLFIQRQPNEAGPLESLPGVSSFMSGEEEENVGIYRLFVSLPMGGVSSSGGSDDTGEEAATDEATTEDADSSGGAPGTSGTSLLGGGGAGP